VHSLGSLKKREMQFWPRNF